MKTKKKEEEAESRVSTPARADNCQDEIANEQLRAAPVHFGLDRF